MTETELEILFYKAHKHFVNKTNEFIWLRSEKPVYSLVNCNFRALAVSHHAESIRAMTSFDKFFGIGLASVVMSQPEDINIIKNQCWRLKLNDAKDGWVENTIFYTPEEVNGYLLDNQKVAALDHIFHRLKAHRLRSAQNDPHQTEIYLYKYLEAKEIATYGLQNDKTLDYPFVTGYANLKGISVQAAAKMILLKHDIHKGFLAETENLRLKYVNMIRDEKDIKNLNPIVEKFYVEIDKFGGI